MKEFVVLVAIAVLGGAGCGGSGGGSNLRTLAEVQTTMSKGGVVCKGTPGPYRKHKNDLSIGADPVEALECTVDGIMVTASRWKTQDQRKTAMKAAKSLICGLDADGAMWIESGTWTVGSENSTAKDSAVTRRIGKALNVKPTTVNCGGAGASGNDSTTEPGPAADSTGVLAQPVQLGDDTTMTLTNPRQGGDDFGPWIEVDVTFANNSSTTATPIEVQVVCAGATSGEGSQADSTFDSNAEVKPGSSSQGTLNLLPTGDSRIGDVTPECKGPAVFRLGDDGPTVKVPAEVLTSFNKAASATGNSPSS